MISIPLSKKKAAPPADDAPTVPQRYTRALRAVHRACAPYMALGYPEAYLRGLRDIAPQLRPATWCEYRRAAVLECLAAGRDDHALIVKSLLQRDCTTTRPGRRYRRRTISADELNALIARAKTRKDYITAFAVHLAGRYGIRAAEFATLEFREGRLWVRSAKRTKYRGNNRCMPIRESERTIFAKFVPKLREISTAALRDRLYRLSREVFPRRMGITFHRIRHQISSNLKASGIDIAIIAKILGHRSTRSTYLYGDPRRGKKGSVAPIVHSEMEPQTTARQPPSRRRKPTPEQ